MKNINMFGKRIPVSILIATIVLSAVGAGIMASQFAKGPQTFYAFDEASVVQLPNRIENIANIEVNALKGEKDSTDFEPVFRLFHRNNKLVLVDVKLMNPDTIKRNFNDFTILIRKQGNNTIVAVLTTGVDPVDLAIKQGSIAIGGNKLVDNDGKSINADTLDDDEDNSDDDEDDIVDAFVDQDPNAENGVVFEAKIFYSARENVFVNEIPIIIGAEVTSQ